jgi:hypothetical protein
MKKKNRTQRTPRTPRPRRDPSPYPKGWDRKRVQSLADHYENQSDDEAIAEAEAAYANRETAMIQIPLSLLPKVQKLLVKRAG